MNNSNLKLSQSTIEKLDYYVYLLADQNNNVFYIGKGTGNRINHHFKELIDKDSKKTDKIKQIIKLGKNVKKIILRHGLTENEALAVENALIDYIGLENLTNIVKGHSKGTGITDLEELKIKYEAEDAVFTENAVLININKLYKRGMSDSEVYEATRKYWKINLEKARQIKLVCAVSQGIIRGVFYQDKWLISKRADRRAYFVGKVANKRDLDKYLNKSVSKYWKKGSQYPIKYIIK
ncbi:MAG TPA: GIY-YIG nuclease family protein [bacterium]|nr:GIY-YIG nuclease family protein [bacterium]